MSLMFKNNKSNNLHFIKCSRWRLPSVGLKHVTLTTLAANENGELCSQ